jgi:hypothetical protein
MRRALLAMALVLSTASRICAQAPVEMQSSISGARFIAVYSVAQREKAVQDAMEFASPPVLGAPVSLTPDASYASDGSHLSFWKPSFVIGTKSGGEAGINFWGKYQEGHMNVAFAPATAKPVLLDCRMLSAGNITYKIYAGNGSAPQMQGDVPLRDGHLLLIVSVLKAGEPLSVELWPTPATQPVGIFGCDLSAVTATPERRHP